METTVTFDSFQIIIGVYFLYVAFKGEGTLYNFQDIPKNKQPVLRKKLRIIYFICALIALAEGALCLWQASQGYALLSARAVNNISLAMSGCIVIILVAVFAWLRKLANGK